MMWPQGLIIGMLIGRLIDGTVGWALRRSVRGEFIVAFLGACVVEVPLTWLFVWALGKGGFWASLGWTP
jgi:uncharacterized membrane protein YeaQ/YmgE (transglycosylase-associated protein family)